MNGSADSSRHGISIRVFGRFFRSWSFDKRCVNFGVGGTSSAHSMFATTHMRLSQSVLTQSLTDRSDVQEQYKGAATGEGDCS